MRLVKYIKSTHFLFENWKQINDFETCVEPEDVRENGLWTSEFTIFADWANKIQTVLKFDL